MTDLILAIDINGGMGKSGKLPWYIKDELEIFKQKTQNSILILGKNTVASLPHLENREIYCVSNSGLIPRTCKNDVRVFSSFENALESAKTTSKKIFVGGGDQLNRYVMANSTVETVHLSVINKEHDCDVFSTIDLSNFVIQTNEKYDTFTHYTLKKQAHPEFQYISLLKDVMKNGSVRDTRNGQTVAVFSRNMSFDLTKGFPLLTTKRVFWRGVVEELLFFLRGDTDSKILEEKGVTIWKGNTSASFIESRNLDYAEGLMGPMYGYQWRKFGATYSGESVGQFGIDQLANVIDLINTDPMSRRIMMTSYNPTQAEEGVLYPCHSIVVQFFVDNSYLDMTCYNRSQDVFLGVPFNIASSALLLTIVGSLTKKIPRHMHMNMGDVHIYKDHIEAAVEQSNRKPFVLPTVSLNKSLSTVQDLEKLTFEDFTLNNYQCHPKIAATMVV